MINNKSDLKHQIDGYINTPNLWEGNDIHDLNQFETLLFSLNKSIYKQKLPQRLGNRVEQFFFNLISNSPKFDIIQKNFQIIENKVTLGELDLLFLNENSPIHLEIIYKFYLYDKSVGETEIEHWIGPNRNDSLSNKLRKLTEKQLPLLHNPFTKKRLIEVDIDYDYVQKVCFKAQLFTPFNEDVKTIIKLNKNCVKGFYINVNQIDILYNNHFYIPQKLDWLTDPNDDVKWIEFTEFKDEILKLTDVERSPLCWMKTPDNTLSKIFVVWW